ncbi:hypothetical protein NLX83_13135 [Allokutzneria sp. A3M-2-11 16]|uniref:hypothetical protein n=1 Tax=Allokutzneria sp. A3M-2-11 16 TaxID=2962043 RepID=UPI0020B75F6D|nr:hypothetical protein [Allokutzneria sp. A3M-2-11 16]MCP3800203.1 hypothetical protein [Allokutzneria sp. A3M-2-11 16]
MLFQDVLSGYVHGELPFSDLSYTTVLNAPGSAKLTTDLDPGVSHVTAQSLVPGAATALYIERHGRIVWSGLLWDAAPDYTTSTLTLECEGWLSYFRRRHIHTSRQYIHWDQADIARDLLQHAGTYGPSSRLGMIEYGREMTGVARDRTYKESERKSIGEAVEQLADVIDGFDFAFRAEWSGPDADELAVRFVIDYPRTGRDRDMSLVDGQNCSILSATVGGKSLSTFALASGAGDGDEQLWTTSDRPSLVHPRLEEVASYSDVKELPTLQGKADRIVRQGSHPVVLPKIELYPDALPGLDSIAVGDQVAVTGGYGLVLIAGTWRVTEIAVSVDDAGADDATLTVAPMEVFADV